jgi:hypothetical protein
MSRSQQDPPPSDREPGLPPELARLVDAGQGAADLDAMYAALRADLERERGLRAWLRARSTAVRAFASLALVALASTMAALGFARPDLASYPFERLALSLSAMALLMLVSMALALRPLQRPALPAWTVPAVVAGALALLAGLYLVSPLEAPHMLDAATVKPALLCMAIGLLLGVPVYGALLLLDRGGSRRALPMAVAAGLAANLVLHIHCPSTQPTHLMLGHFGAAALLLIAIALWVRARD